MRLLVENTDTHRLFMEKTEIGIRRWIIENINTRSVKIFNSLWYKQMQVVNILKKL